MPKSPKSTPPRSNLTLEQHWQIIQYKKEHPSLSTAEIARVFAEKFDHPTLNQSTVSRTLNKEERLRPFSTHTTRKKISQVRCPEVEEALMLWYTAEVERGSTITGPMLRAKAVKLADEMGIPEDARPKYSNGWLDCYKSRHQLKFGNRPSHNSQQTQSQAQASQPPPQPERAVGRSTSSNSPPALNTNVSFRRDAPASYSPQPSAGTYSSPQSPAGTAPNWARSVSPPSSSLVKCEEGDDCCPYAVEAKLANSLQSLRLHLETCPNLSDQRPTLLASFATIACAVHECSSPPRRTPTPSVDSSSFSEPRSPRSPLSPVSPESAGTQSPPPPDAPVSLPYRRQRWLDLVTSPSDDSRHH